MSTVLLTHYQAFDRDGRRLGSYDAAESAIRHAIKHGLAVRVLHRYNWGGYTRLGEWLYRPDDWPVDWRERQ